MKKLFVLTLMGLLMLSSCCGNSAEEPADDKSKNVGKTVMIDNQTYTIISYNSILEQYKLSNGTWVDDTYPISY